MKRSFLLALATSLLLAMPPSRAQSPTAPVKVLRYAFRVAETGFDPAQTTDLYSSILEANIFDAPLEFEFLASPTRVRPNTAAAMPEVSADFRTFTFKLQRGIYFADDPAFEGRRRELVAADYVYSIKRHYDPRWKSGRLYWLEGNKLLGLSELRQQALKTRQPFDYDREVEGARVIDRYTFQVKLAEPNPRFIYVMADPSLVGAVAREVVERYGDHMMEHPVGTGAYRLAEWRRSSRIVLERNPGYRERFYDEHPPEGDTRLQQVAAQFKGRRLPMIDRVEVSIIEENQPRWLAFLNQEHDMVEIVPNDFVTSAMPNNRLAPNLAKRGIHMERYPRADVSYSYFAMENPVVGGYTPDKIALRRAISLAVDVEREIRLARRSQAIPAQSIVSPLVAGYQPAFKSEMSDFNRGRAKALLDLYGYVDKDGDGWRDQPDGSPLELEYATTNDGENRQLADLWQKNMAAIGVRMRFKLAQWPEHLKASRAGKLMMWGVGWSASIPDAEDFLSLAYGPNKGQSNHARFDLPAYNQLFDQLRVLPDGPERQAGIDEAKRLLVAYMPYKVHVHRVFTDMTHAWVQGYHRNVFVKDFWRYIDVDTAQLASRSRQR
ncbi:ABC transporter substrate-binding protein [Ideonella sp. BN130291]|uniref:ABC transporter substrate-binding protein n=1 Tax=Ideonella sp. BN130291 TaxID=3112940 RepID=UPI002E274FA8|nr:ABC transporter substrate-binding protein [Ideonella sp. BN130291]